jgi:putative peptide zinc metalloprotease protein
MSQLTLESTVDLGHLSIQPDGDDEYTVGDAASQEFIRIPYEGVAAIRLLDGSRTLGEAQVLLLETEEIEVDFLDFAQTLLELNLVRSLDGQVLNEAATTAAQGPDLGWMQPVGKILFSKISLVLYVLFALSTIVMFAVRPELFPRFQDFFVFPSSIGLSTLVMFVASWLLLFFHETGHLFAAVAAGAPVRFRLSVRWFWVVMEAEMTGLWSQPRRSRYVPFLAGMCWDAFILFVSVLVQLWLPEGGVAAAIFQMTAVLTLFQFASQLLIFVRTDLYFVLITATNAANLSGDAKLYLKRTLLRSKNAVAQWETLQPTDRRRASWFGLLYLVGALVSCYLFGMISIPAALTAVGRAWTEVVSHDSSRWLVADGLIILGVTLLQVALWVIGAVSRYRNSQAQRNNGMEKAVES